MIFKRPENGDTKCKRSLCIIPFYFCEKWYWLEKVNKHYVRIACDTYAFWKLNYVVGIK